jgi:hypothetical protein
LFVLWVDVRSAAGWQPDTGNLAENSDFSVVWRV